LYAAIDRGLGQVGVSENDAGRALSGVAVQVSFASAIEAATLAVERSPSQTLRPVA